MAMTFRVLPPGGVDRDRPLRRRAPPLHLPSQRSGCSLLWESQRMADRDRHEVVQGTLALMVLRTLQDMGPLHGFGIARRIEQISQERLSINPGTLYPILLKLEQEGAI